jgi:hypothetical protein
LGLWFQYPVVSKNRKSASSRGPIIIIEHSTEATAASNRCGAISETDLRVNENISDALMVSLAVIVSNELSHGVPQRVLSKQNDSLQTGLLDAADKTFGIAIQVW